MIQHRRVEILLPADWVQQLDEVARSQQMNRSGVIREATRRYLLEHRKEAIREELRAGYEKMGPLNLELAMDEPGDVTSVTVAAWDRE